MVLVQKEAEIALRLKKASTVRCQNAYISVMCKMINSYLFGKMEKSCSVRNDNFYRAGTKKKYE